MAGNGCGFIIGCLFAEQYSNLMKPGGCVLSSTIMTGMQTLTASLVSERFLSM